MKLLYIHEIVLLLMTVMLVGQDTELGQLHQVIGQLQEEEKKTAEQAKKLVEELKGKYFMVGVTAGVISLLDGPL